MSPHLTKGMSSQDWRRRQLSHQTNNIPCLLFTAGCTQPQPRGPFKGDIIVLDLSRAFNQMKTESLIEKDEDFPGCKQGLHCE